MMLKPRDLLITLLDEWRIRRALELPDESWVSNWTEIAPNRPQLSYRNAPAGRSRNVREWGNKSTAIVSHFLVRLLDGSVLSESDKSSAAVRLMSDAWNTIRNHDRALSTDDTNKILIRATTGGTFRLNYRWLRVNLAVPNNLWMCGTCLGATTTNIRNVCPRNRCPGELIRANSELLKQNHYRDFI